MNNEYRYELNYINDSTKVTYSFRAYCNVEWLIKELSYFLLACGWSESQLKEILNYRTLGEDDIDEYEEG